MNRLGAQIIPFPARSGRSTFEPAAYRSIDRGSALPIFDRCAYHHEAVESDRIDEPEAAPPVATVIELFPKH